MKVLNFGSASIDLVFSVDHIAKAGETIASRKRELFPGGKGLNQSIALAKAGVEIYHAGAIGKDGEMLLQALVNAGVRTDYLEVTDEATGNALIQVDAQGQNCIVLFAGANFKQTIKHIDHVLGSFGKGDILVLQNEVNYINELIDKAFDKGMTIVLNPSPFNAVIEACNLEKVQIFMLNEIEGNQLTGEQQNDRILAALGKRFPKAKIVLTLGPKGVLYQDAYGSFREPAWPAEVVDTTAAGDTFTGFFIGAMIRGISTQESLRIASKASAISVSRKGASSSIPTWDEVLQ